MRSSFFYIQYSSIKLLDLKPAVFPPLRIINFVHSTHLDKSNYSEVLFDYNFLSGGGIKIEMPIIEHVQMPVC